MLEPQQSPITTATERLPAMRKSMTEKGQLEPKAMTGPKDSLAPISLKKSPNFTELLDLRNIIALDGSLRSIIDRNGPVTNEYFLSNSAAEFSTKSAKT